MSVLRYSMIMNRLVASTVVIILFVPTMVRASCPTSQCMPYGACVADTTSCGDHCEERWYVIDCLIRLWSLE